MKNYPSGFLPVDFKKAGKILFFIGLAFLMVKAVFYIKDSFFVPDLVLYFGIGITLVSIYMMFAGSKK